LTDFYGTGDLLFYLEADFLLGVLDLEALLFGTDNFLSEFILFLWVILFFLESFAKFFFKLLFGTNLKF